MLHHASDASDTSVVSDASDLVVVSDDFIKYRKENILKFFDMIELFNIWVKMFESYNEIIENGKYKKEELTHLISDIENSINYIKSFINNKKYAVNNNDNKTIINPIILNFLRILISEVFYEIPKVIMNITKLKSTIDNF